MPPPVPWLHRRWVHATVLCVCALMVVAFRYHALDLALDSDEGDYAHVAQRLLAGDRLYTDVFDNKPPQVHWTFALALWLFGDSDHSIRWLGIVFSLGSLAAFYACARQLFAPGVALWVVALYPFLNVEPRSHCHITKIEQFITPFLFAALAAALRWRTTRRTGWLALAALGIGIASSYKPWFVLHVPLLMAVAWRGPAGESSPWPARFKRWLVIGCVAALPGLLWLGWLLAKTDFAAAYDALVVFNRDVTLSEVKQSNPLAHMAVQWFHLLTGDALRSMLWPLWWVGIACTLLLALRRDKPPTPGWQFLGVWTLLLLAEVTSGPRLSTYYFGPILPLVVMATVGGLWVLSRGKRRGFVALNALPALLLWTHVYRNYLCLNDSQITLAMWGHDLYKDFRVFGRRLREILPPDERLYMWGFDTIHFYSQRPSGSRYHYVTPGAFSAKRMEQLVDEVVRNRPMVFYHNRAFPRMPASLIEFVKRNYVPVHDGGLFALFVSKEKYELWEEGVNRMGKSAAAP